MTESALAIVILAAGKGTRMKSALPKVLHKVAGLPMLGHVIKTAEALSPQKIIIIAAPDQVEAFRHYTGAHEIVVQNQQLGTGHAVRCAENALKNFNGDVLVLYGDAPLIKPETLARLKQRKNASDHPQIVVLAASLHNPCGFGRLVTAQDKLLQIVEEKDATETQRQIKLVNSGILICDGKALWLWLSELQSNNAQGEYYLTDIIARAAQNESAVFEMTDTSGEAFGVNERWQQAEAEYYWQQRARTLHMENGVALLSPVNIFFSHDTVIAEDVTIHPNVVFGPGVTVESGAEVLPFSHLEGCTVKSGARVGPFARIRPGAMIGKNARIGNFVEIKNAEFGDGAKANHLSYIGDAKVGAAANIGAGTITCNYDGIRKSKTEIGAGAFIGSNSALVAPVTIGEGAMVAAGSVITKNVEPGALGLARGVQKNIANWAKEFFSKGKA